MKNLRNPNQIQTDDDSFDEISEETKKELIDCTDKYVVDNVTEKVMWGKKKTKAIATITSTKIKDGSFEINEKITKELDVTFTSSNDLITSAQTITTNDELKSEEESGNHNIFNKEFEEFEDSDDDLDEMDKNI
ncbi:hypothetical protein Glove_469g27 [Diversispora epigaea]|uniref:Uncharacterized protein n=1 Tax=Diversispora epigaea TaxID=1348612 RepID=A0A397GQM1_9GLOM|nr:hypothetical protein Glove_469g27 [Diversispora epigaea]